MANQAYMSSPVSAELVETMRNNLNLIRQSPTSKESGQLLLKIVNDMTEEAMKYYFFQPMDIIDAGTLTRKFVSMGVSGSLKMVNSMGKKAVGSLEEKQVLALADFMEGLITEQ